MDVCFIVRDVNGQALAYVYFEEEPGRRSSKTAAKAGLSRTSGRPTRARGLSFSCNPASVDLNQMPSLSAGGGFLAWLPFSTAARLLAFECKAG
jgi:hypothetical protein